MSTAEERFEEIMMSVRSIDCLKKTSIPLPYELVFKIQKNFVLGVLEDMLFKIKQLEYKNFWNAKCRENNNEFEFSDDGIEYNNEFEFSDDGIEDEIDLLHGIKKLLIDSQDNFGLRFVEPGEYDGYYDQYDVVYDSTYSENGAYSEEDD
jgi:DNA-directed RNA polymerase alpha subunit